MKKIINHIIFLVMLDSFCAFNVSKIEAAEENLNVSFNATGKRSHLAAGNYVEGP